MITSSTADTDIPINVSKFGDWQYENQNQTKAASFAASANRAWMPASGDLDSAGSQPISSMRTTPRAGVVVIKRRSVAKTPAPCRLGGGRGIRLLRDVHVDMPKPTLKSSAFEVFGFDVEEGITRRGAYGPRTGVAGLRWP